MNIIKENRNYHIVGFFIGFLGGFFGLDRFYRGQFIIGFIKLFLTIGLWIFYLAGEEPFFIIGFIWWLFDNIVWAKEAGGLHKFMIDANKSSERNT